MNCPTIPLLGKDLGEKFSVKVQPHTCHIPSVLPFCHFCHFWLYFCGTITEGRRPSKPTPGTTRHRPRADPSDDHGVPEHWL